MSRFFYLFFLFPQFIFSEEIEVYCRDSFDGSFLPCKLDLGEMDYSLKEGKNLIDFKDGSYKIVAKFDGYKEVSTHFYFPSKLKSINFYLDNPSKKFDYEEVKNRQKIRGFIYDKEKGVPLENVMVKVEDFEILSDIKGYFEIDLNSREYNSGEDLPVVNLYFFKTGYKNLNYKNILNLEGVTNLIIDMEEGEGDFFIESEHHFFNPVYFEEEEKEEGQSPPVLIKFSENIEEQFLLQVIDPPDTIRVGMNCTCTTCSYVDVLSLETYVKRGLNDEWIPSWNTHSLRAGSVAYRSYGSYYVYNPINPNYDICSSTCCQVNDTDTSSSTNLATDKTAGILLQRNGSIFRSEYSSENNSWDDPNDGLTCTNSDLSCGNGYAGSPANYWPCLSDSPCSGYGCYGHGRGMCQWGTQRWAASNSKLWKWIVNHYYNNNGSGSGLRTAYMTSPFQINSVSPVPSTIAPGDSFTINLNVTSFAEISHYQIMIGASLYSPSTGYISDPSNDNKITLIPGSNSPSRQFLTPSDIPEGTYNLIVALWLDVDENNSITGDDLSLITYTLSNAIYVSGIVYGTCSNPYIVSSFPYNHSLSNNNTYSILSNYNCNSLRDSTGKEVVYKITLTQEGILSASISPSSPLDLYLTKSCASYACLSFGDSLIEEYLQAGEYYLILDGNSISSYSLNINFTQKDLSRPSDNTSLKIEKSSNQLLLSWQLPAINIFGGAENISKTNIFRGTTPQNLNFYLSANGNSTFLNDLSSNEDYYYRLSFEDTSGNRSLPCQLETILDNQDAFFEGNWQNSSYPPDKWGEDYSFVYGSLIDANKAHYSPIFFCPYQNFDIYAYYSASTDRCTGTKFLINHSSGSSTLYVDQTKDGGRWNFLGNFYYERGNEVLISDGSCQSNKKAVADALKWSPAPSKEFIMDDDEATFIGTWLSSSGGYNGDYFWRSTGGNGSNYVLWVPYLYEKGNYDIYVWYRSGTNRTTQAPYIITTASGDITIYVNQQVNGSQWFYLGNFELTPSTA